MLNSEKNYDQLIKEIKEELIKLNSENVSMQEAIELFEEGMQKITLAKNQLENYKGKINKILEDNSVQEFE
ncbi:exodeoxyribonuclease VII small subunit [Williamsoniiplasma somnilux]|uniref:Exodeoxyribonuclease VII small subunit n=1 Tax=Williamsoniiplasma somnilux TaxID=215578 RepID=A0A2K8NY61_9MOLU|nr:exodeoxyribonuclease VII small subunit [Williamsoniiplasma somnilux]ATZ18760.1 exodeoxyribonuclease VII small subunit [Williamsoniiplasma somnilux]